MARRPRVTVLGSLNTDISVAVPRFPRPGETVLGSQAAIGPGGKGANQAVAAARLGAAVRMVGCRGDDEFGRSLGAGLTREGVDTGGVRVIAGVVSGVALITVDGGGENAIAVAPGANALAGPEEVAAALAVGCDVLVLSAEVPAGVLAGALDGARDAGVMSLLNLAPVPDGAAAMLAGGVDWLVVNAAEAAALAGGAVPGGAVPGGTVSGGALAGGAVPGGTAAPDGTGGTPLAGRPAGEPGAGPEWARRAAAELTRRGAEHAVVTLGAAGAVLDGPAGALAVPGFAVRSVDSVGAGDAFVAGLAVALAAGVAPAAAVRAACAVGAAATTRRGAQAGLPSPAEVVRVTGLTWPVPL